MTVEHFAPMTNRCFIQINVPTKLMDVCMEPNFSKYIIYLLPFVFFLFSHMHYFVFFRTLNLITHCSQPSRLSDKPSKTLQMFVVTNSMYFIIWKIILPAIPLWLFEYWYQVWLQAQRAVGLVECFEIMVGPQQHCSLS